jgi:hypothetical protein
MNKAMSILYFITGMQFVYLCTGLLDQFVDVEPPLVGFSRLLHKDVV